MGYGRSGRSAWACRSLALVLVVLLARPAGAGQGEIRRHDPAPRPVPVILIPGLDGRAEVWGRSPEQGRRGTGLLGFLAGEGYQEGRDVFTFDYSRVPEPDLVRLAARELTWRIDQVRERTGAERVDLVGYGYGGLIARYYLRLPGAAADVRTLVMIATPNQGAFSAHVLRVAAEQARQEAWNTLPAGPVGPDLPAFTGAAAYVDQRAVVYGRLYREYLAESELLRGPGGQAGPDFHGWLATARPDLYRYWFLEGQAPPLAADGCPSTPPRDGEALTRAYYEFLAMEAGRHHYLKAAGRKTVTLSRPSLPALWSPDWRAAIVAYLKTVVLDYIIQRGKAYLAANQTRLAVEVLGWIMPLETNGVALERLLPERIRYPAGPDAVGRPTYQALAANQLLLDWNREEPATRDARYVVIAGHTLNLAGRLWRGVTDNDLVVELESTLVPLGVDDRLIVVSGIWRGTHLAFLNDARVHRAVADALAIPRPIASWLSLPDRLQPWSKHGRGTADAWRPTYLRLTGPAASAGRLRVTITAERARAAAADGLAYHLWAHALGPDGSVSATWHASFSQQGPVPEAALDLPAPGPHHLLVGVRLVPLARPGEVYLPGEEDGLAGPCRDPWASALLGAGGKALPFSYRLTWEPTAAAGPESAVLPGAPPAAASPAPAPAPGNTALPFTPGTAGTSVSPPPPPPAPPPASGPAPGPASPSPAATAPPDGALSPSPSAAAATPSAPPPVTAAPPPTPPPGPAGPLPIAGGTQGLGEVSGQTEKPLLIEVKTVRKLMTLKKEARTYHVRWEWELGDGRRVVEEDPGRLTSTLTPTYTAPGTYVVRAFSFSNQGTILREQRFHVTASPDALTGPPLKAETIAEPRVVVALEGPAAWVVGRPARFTVRAWTEDPRYGKIAEVKADPGWAFDVVWENPGTYAVAAAVSVKVNYSVGGRSLTITNTYLHGVKVDVGVAAVSR